MHSTCCCISIPIPIAMDVCDSRASIATPAIYQPLERWAACVVNVRAALRTSRYARPSAEMTMAMTAMMKSSNASGQQRTAGCQPAEARRASRRFARRFAPICSSRAAGVRAVLSCA